MFIWKWGRLLQYIFHLHSKKNNARRGPADMTQLDLKTGL